VPLRRAAELVDRAERFQHTGDVLAHGGLGGLGVAGADRLDDAFVLGEALLEPSAFTNPASEAQGQLGPAGQK
jgi:hypothetical protein